MFNTLISRLKHSFGPHEEKAEKKEDVDIPTYVRNGYIMEPVKVNGKIVGYSIVKKGEDRES